MVNSDEVWEKVWAEVEAMHAALGGEVEPLEGRTRNLCRIFAITGWRLATEQAADGMGKAVAGG